MTSSAPPPLSDTDKREVCDLHGWVGRKVFQRERHDLCEAPRDNLPPEDDEEEAHSDGYSSEEVEEIDAAEDDDPDPEDESNGESSVGQDNSEPRWSRASARRQGIPPKKTLAVRRITQLELKAGRDELQALGADGPYWRPKTRADCADVPRPCPYVACKYSLYLDVSETGSIILNFPHLDPGEMPPDQSCALDLAEQRAMTLEEIAVVTNLTRERIRQVELKALIRRARPAAVAMGLGPDDVASIDARRQVGPSADLEETGADGPSDVAAILSVPDRE